MIPYYTQTSIYSHDVGNAFITADCLEKLYSRAGPEFGDREGAIMTVVKKA